MSRTIEMTWTCSACQTVNLGRYTTCQNCGDPKDPGEQYQMPTDTASAASVVAPDLLEVAKSGPNWHCPYCGSDQRASDGGCSRCGAGRAGKSAAGSPAKAKAPTTSRWILVAIALTAIIGAICLVSAFFRLGARQREPSALATMATQVVEVAVASVSWRHVVTVERLRLVNREGFAETRPEGALNVQPSGERQHHVERIADGVTTESYQEQVPYQDSETYSEQAQCGEDCTDIPQNCSEQCTPNGNGFADCHTVCTGGGRNCSPRYCTQTRTRQVTRYRSETRTRSVTRYREEPRMAPWFTWREWVWEPERNIERSGTGLETTWPTEEELSPASPLGEGERERTTRREATYDVSFTPIGGDQANIRSMVYHPTEAIFPRFVIGSHWTVTVDTGGTILGVPEAASAQ